MASNVGALTNRRKRNLTTSGRGRNSATRNGLKPSGPENAGYETGGKFIGSTSETWITLIGGAALATFGILELINRKSRLVNVVIATVGGGLLVRGISGLVSPTDGMTEEEVDLDNPGASIGHLHGIKVEEEIVIDRAAHDLYDFWRDFSNLPRIMRHLERVDVLDDTRSHWVAKAPLGSDVTWDAEVYIERVGEMISWRSVEGSEVETAGSVRFESEGDDSTRVIVNMKIDPPAGMLGIAIAKLFGEDPASQITSDLKNFKKMMEAEGASASAAASALDRSRTNGHSKDH